MHYSEMLKSVQNIDLNNVAMTKKKEIEAKKEQKLAAEEADRRKRDRAKKKSVDSNRARGNLSCRG